MSNPANKIASPPMTRRTFLAASLASGLTMGFGLALPVGCAREEIVARRFAPTVWFEMNESGKVKINIAKAEMGQHVGTALARVVADELGVRWADVSIDHVDTDPQWGYMVTGGSWSVFTTFKQLSQAGAAGRTVLLEAGAELLGVDAAGCHAQDSEVICGDQRVSFAEVVAKGNIDRVFSSEEVDALPLKPPAERRFIGKQAAALDIPEKSTGTAVYGIDAERPGMLFGRPVLPPTRYGSTVTGVDDSAAKKIAGYVGFEILEDPSETLQGWVVALAHDQWSAFKAADALSVTWEPGPTANIDEQAVLAAGERLVRARDTGVLLVNDGDVDAATAAAEKIHTAVYRTATALHFTLEPVNAVAEQRDGTWHIYTGNQWQSLILPVLATSLQVPEDSIVIHQHYLGGGFGRRLFGDYILPAALAAKAVGKPVKVVFKREDDARFDCVRSPSVQQFTASLDAAGAVTGIEHAAAAGWPTLTMAPGFLIDGVDGKGKIDTFSISGADHWYTLPSHRVRAINNELAQSTFLPGWLRAVGPGWIGWGVESFMDELAVLTNTDPIEFRLSLLDAAGKNAGKAPESVSGAARLANVLRRVRDQADWDTALPANEARGVAVAHGQERTMPTWVACVAHVAVDPGTGRVTLKRLSETIDCGTVVHPDGAMAQAQSAALWGVSLALHEGTRLHAGQVADRNLDTYTPLRMRDVPELDIEFVTSDAFPVGLGEPPLIPVAPAIANAVHAATGVRIRDLPIRAEAIVAGRV